MLLGLFLVGSFWFWVLMTAAVLAIGLCVASDSFGKATFSVLATFALLGFLGDFNVLHWLRENLAEFAVTLVLYLAVGTAWSIAKWWFFVRGKRDQYAERKQEFLIDHGLAWDSPMPDKLKAEWRSKWGDSVHGYEPHVAFPPKARAYKGKIMAWMMYWPWSFVVTIIDDPIRKLFNAIFRAIQNLYQRISDRAFKDVKIDFEASPPKAPPVTNGNGSAKDQPPPQDDDDLPYFGP